VAALVGAACKWAAKIEKNNRKKARERRKSESLEKGGRKGMGRSGLWKRRPGGGAGALGGGWKRRLLEEAGSGGCLGRLEKVRRCGQAAAVRQAQNKKGPLWKQKAV